MGVSLKVKGGGPCGHENLGWGGEGAALGTHGREGKGLTVKGMWNLRPKGGEVQTEIL